MQDMCADSNEYLVVKLIISVGQGGKKESLESPASLELICFKAIRFKFDIAGCVLWSLVQKEVLNLLHTYVVVLALGTHIPLCLSIT